MWVEMAEAWKVYWDKPGMADRFRVWDPDNPRYEDTQPTYIDDIIIDFIPEYDKILDIGCGVGRYAKLLDKHGRTGEYHGFDYSVEMIKIAEEVCDEKFSFYQGDAEYIESIGGLPALDSFDVIIMIAVLRHLPMEKAMRVLKKMCEYDKPIVFTAFIGSEAPDARFTHTGSSIVGGRVKGLGEKENPVIDRPFSFRQIMNAIGKRRVEINPIDSRLDFLIGGSGLGQRAIFKVYPRKNPHYVEELYSLYETYEINSVLDVGCGFGRCYPRIGRGKTYVGIDLSSEKIEVAQKRFPEAEWMFGNFLDYKPDQVFDALFCFCFFCLNHSDENLRRIIYKMTKMGKRIFLIDTRTNMFWDEELKAAGWIQEHSKHVWGPGTYIEVWRNPRLT